VESDVTTGAPAPGPAPPRRRDSVPCTRAPTAGSIRIPSAFCGIVGVKATYGRVPLWPVSNNDYATHTGPMTRTVADAALMLQVRAGPDPWDITSLESRRPIIRPPSRAA